MAPMSDIGFYGAAARGFEMKVSVRLDDDLVGEIDRVAAAHGQTRSAWIALALARAALAPANDVLPTPAPKEGDASDGLVRITVRVERSEAEAIVEAGAESGLNRNEWIKRTIRWQLWDKAAQLKLAPTTYAELEKIRKQVRAIGRNVNQAVHAMNAANQPGSTLELSRIAEPFIETCADVKALLTETRRSLAVYIGSEVGYWTSAFAEARA